MIEPNPYLSPANIDDEGDGLSWRDTWARCWPVLLLGPLAGAALGLATNAINGWVGPSYFTAIVGWESDIWARAMAQGMLEGALYGFGNGVFLLIAALTVLCAADFIRIAQAVLVASFFALILWTLGGMAAQVALAAFPGAFQQAWWPWTGPTYSFMWVFGSIQAVVLGSPLATLAALFWLRQQLPTPAIADSATSPER